MFYLDQETRKRYRIGTPFTYGDVNYTYTGASHNTFMSLGFVQVIEEPRPSGDFYIVNSPCNDDGSWSYSERPLDQVQKNYCQQQVQAAQGNLKSSDYLFARAAENTTRAGEASPVPAEVMTQREAVRLTCKANCALIMSAADIAALEAMIKAPAEIAEDPMAEEIVMIPNPEPHLEPLPTIDVSAYLTAELI
jgi:hypothetical protein